MAKVSMVRIYLTEGENQVQPLMAHLHDNEKVRGVTVFRGISGFGKSGSIHSSSLLDMSLDLPLVIEFFDDPEKVSNILQHLDPQLPKGHVVRWDAEVNDE